MVYTKGAVWRNSFVTLTFESQWKRRTNSWGVWSLVVTEGLSMAMSIALQDMRSVVLPSISGGDQPSDHQHPSPNIHVCQKHPLQAESPAIGNLD